jgi:2-dehydro-3-deoxyphosphogluconate aldolase/(4S)-4-hydroxy-2-oxoglutarate aldolase
MFVKGYQMSKEDTLSRIKKVGLLSVIRGPSPDLTLKMVDALIAGGVYGIEITYTTPNATEVVKLLDESFGDQILLGMGTLTKPEHAAMAKEAGALFIVSPHCNEELAKAMVETDLGVMIGALTPTEVVQARAWGADVVKVFPGSLVGPGYLKALRGPFPDILVMPTGGVSVDNVADWFAAGAFAVGAGSSLCPRNLAEEGRFDKITERAEAFVKAVEKARSE